MSGFDPHALLRVLGGHGVEFVLIGGYAARLHGASRPTVDLDVTPRATSENLERLAGALRALDARVRVDGVEGGLPFSTDAAALASMDMLNLVTRHGDLDVMLRPAGVGGYERMIASSSDRSVAGVVVHVASLLDIIASKDAVGRPKDVEALVELRSIQAGLSLRRSRIEDGAAGSEPECDRRPGLDR